MHDFLKLKDSSFSDVRLVVLSGRSGSGKTTALNYLVHEHVDFKDSDVTILSPAPINWDGLKVAGDIVAIDELLFLNDLVQVYKLILCGKSVLAASHLPAPLFYPLLYLCSARLYQTDRDCEKLAYYLNEKQIRYSQQALRCYKSIFGSVYTDLDIILERCPGDEFDRALYRFIKFNKIHHCPDLMRSALLAR